MPTCLYLLWPDTLKKKNCTHIWFTLLMYFQILIILVFTFCHISAITVRIRARNRSLIQSFYDPKHRTTSAWCRKNELKMHCYFIIIPLPHQCLLFYFRSRCIPRGSFCWKHCLRYFNSGGSLSFISRNDKNIFFGLKCI